MSAIPRCGATSAAPETGTTSTAQAGVGEEAARDAREARGDAVWRFRVRSQVGDRVDFAVFAGGDDEPAVAEFEVEQRVDRSGPIPRRDPIR